MLPFGFDMTPIAAFAFLLGMHAVVSTTGDITSVLFGVPSEGTAAATTLDAYGHAVQSAGDKSAFGKGDVRGSLMIPLPLMLIYRDLSPPTNISAI